jgi:hypothetical protein
MDLPGDNRARAGVGPATDDVDVAVDHAFDDNVAKEHGQIAAHRLVRADVDRTDVRSAVVDARHVGARSAGEARHQQGE